MKFSNFVMDPSKETQGVWVEAGAGLRLKIARATNRAYRDELVKLTKPHAAAIRTNSLNIELAEKLTREAAAKHIIHGWENLEDDNGNLIPFSHEKAAELFEKSPDFLKLVLEYSNDAELFRESGVGNS